MNKLKHIRLASIVICVLWLGFIFYNSSQTIHQSQDRSRKVVQVTSMIKTKITTSTIGNKYTHNIEHYIRKGAHAFEFFVLSIIISTIMRSCKIKGIQNIINTLFIVLLCGVLDEFHQLYVPGRGSSVKDVLIDFAGGIIGVILLNTILTIKSKYNISNNKQVNS